MSLDQRDLNLDLRHTEQTHDSLCATIATNVTIAIVNEIWIPEILPFLDSFIHHYLPTLSSQPLIRLEAYVYDGIESGTHGLQVNRHPDIIRRLRLYQICNCKMMRLVKNNSIVLIVNSERTIPLRP